MLELLKKIGADLDDLHKKAKVIGQGEAAKNSFDVKMRSR